MSPANQPDASCPVCGGPVADASVPCPRCQGGSAPPPAAPSAAPADDAWRQAREAFARCDYAAAAAACDRVLTALPAHEEAARLQAQAEEKRQQLEAALQLANGYFNKGQYELALVHFNAAVGLCPGDEGVRRKQEMAKLLAGQDLTAYTPKPVRRMTARWADEVVPSPVSTVVMAGLILAGVVYLTLYMYGRTQKRRLEAERLFRQVEQRLVMQEYLSGESQETYQRLTTVYGDTRFAKDAAEMLAKARARKLEEAPRLLDQADTYLHDRQPTLALELARDVLHWDPDNARAQDLVSRAEEGVDQWEAQSMREALAGTGRKLRDLKTPGDVTAAGAAAPGEAEASSAVADLLEQQDEVVSPAVEQIVRRGQDRFQAGDYAAAAFLWEKALTQHGRPHPILARLVEKARLLEAQERRRFEGDRAAARALEDAQRWPEALVAWRAAQLHRPSDEETARKIAALEAQRRLPSEAPPATPAPVPGKRRTEAQRWRDEAAAHERRGEWRQAAAACRKALAQAPDPSVRQRQDLNRLMDVQERRRARQEGASDFWHDLVLAEAYLAQQHPPRARQLLLTLLPPPSQRQPGPRALLLALIGRSYAEEQHDEEAVASYRQSLQVASVGYVQHSLAQILWRNGDYLEAMRLWEQALRYTPQQIEVIASLAAGYVLMDVPAKAQALMQPLKAWKADRLRATQRYPTSVRPDYWLGLTTPRALLAEACDRVAQTWLLLDEPLEALRWRQLAQAERAAEAAAARRTEPPRHPWWRFWSH